MFCFLSFSQTGELVGEYYFQAGNEKEHLIEYSLAINPDGTFLFHSYENHQNGIPWEKNQYGKGKWNLDGKVVSFFTDKEGDIDEKHTLDFSNSKARFITKPSRDKTDRVVETSLQFFKSGIFWIERLRILKK
jgi:hypothetical protein